MAKSIINNTTTWGNDSADYGSDWYVVSDGQTNGFQGNGYVYATKINQALKNATLVPYAIAETLKSTEIPTGSGTFDINPQTVVSAADLSDFCNNFKAAVNSYIASVKVNEATKATQDESANNIKETYAASLTGNNTASISLINKNGFALSTITVNNVTNAINASSATTASKLGSATKGSTTKPIWLDSGTASDCLTYAGGTAVTLNNTSKAGDTASFYAPTTAGTNGYWLMSNGSETDKTPTWSESTGFMKRNSLSSTTYKSIGTNHLIFVAGYNCSYRVHAQLAYHERLSQETQYRNEYSDATNILLGGVVYCTYTIESAPATGGRTDYTFTMTFYYNNGNSITKTAVLPLSGNEISEGGSVYFEVQGTGYYYNLAE